MAALSSASDADGVLARAAAGVLRSPKATVAAVACVLLLVTAIIGPSLVPQDPYDLNVLDIMDAKLPPGGEGMDGTVFRLGTDGQGRDMLSAMVYGLRTSLFVGVLAGVVALVVGTVLGLVAAFAGGRIDSVIMRIVDLMLGLPTLLVALMLLALLGQGVWKVVLALVLVQWAMFARAVRGAALVEKNKDYVEAARATPLPGHRVVVRHLLPNCLPPLIVVGTVQVANAISLEATLSFLGLGLPPTEPSLGMLIANGFQYMMSGRTWISVYPGIALIVLIVAINIVGDQLRDQFNPRLRR